MVENRVVRESMEACITPAGNLVVSTVPDLRNEMKQLLQAGVTTLVVDLTNVSIVDSMGIGCLVAAHNSLQKSAGRLVVTNASTDIYDLFKSMRLNRHFSVSAAGSERNE